MKIGIDVSRVTKTYLTGTEYYSIELIKAIAKLSSADDFILYAQKDPSKRLGKLPPNFQTKLMPFPKLWSQIRLSIEMIAHKPDILFVPSHLIPLIHPKNSVVTLHDLGFKHFPELYPPHELLYHNWGMNYSTRHAAKIITDSNYTKNDLVSTYAIEPEKIEVVYLGCEIEKFRPKNPVKKEPYIFFIGRLEEKKNIIGMIRAYGILRKEKNIKHQLILAGKPGFGYENIQREIENLPGEIQKDIIQLGYIEEREYIQRLQEAEIFLFCSFFEGFGLPIIEAMAAETAVITSNVTSMPEIGGNAVITVNPRNHLEIAGMLSKLIHSAKLRDRQIYRGKNRARNFSWDKTALQTLDILHGLNNPKGYHG